MAAPRNNNVVAAAAMFPSRAFSSYGRPIVPTARMAVYASGEYDRLLDEAEMAAYAQYIAGVFERTLGMSGGGRRYKQRGGAGEFRQACIQVYRNILDGSSGLLNATERAAAAALLATFGDLKASGRTAGLAAAGYTIGFGVPEMPWLYSAVNTAMSNTPTVLWNSASNIVASVISSSKLVLFGAGGVAALVAFAAAIIGLRHVNTLLFRGLFRIGIGGKDIILSLLNSSNNALGNTESLEAGGDGRVVDASIAAAVAAAPAKVYKVGGVTFNTIESARETARNNMAEIKVVEAGVERDITAEEFDAVAGAGTGSARRKTNRVRGRKRRSTMRN